jgi:hypothetical protein
VIATFSENVTVTGSPRLTIVIDNNRTATYMLTSVINPRLVFFRYAILIGDPDNDGIRIIEDAIDLNSGTIKDLAGHDATITHDSVAANSSYKVKAF